MLAALVEALYDLAAEDGWQSWYRYQQRAFTPLRTSGVPGTVKRMSAGAFAQCAATPVQCVSRTHKRCTCLTHQDQGFNGAA